MALRAAEWYLTGMSTLGFVLAALHARLRGRKGFRAASCALMASAVLGGAWGVLPGMLLFERRAEKDNMTAYVLAVCGCIVQTVICLLVRRGGVQAWNFAFGRFFDAHPLLTICLCAMNAVAFVAFGWDKLNAIRDRRRIRIVTLLALALAGGSVGALAGMYAFRHKTRKPYFAFGVPLMLATHLLVIFCWMNIG